MATTKARSNRSTQKTVAKPRTPNPFPGEDVIGELPPLPAPPAPKASRARKASSTAKAADTATETVKARKSKVVTEQLIAKVKQALTKAPAEGMSLNDLMGVTGLTYRQVHNATWRMEGAPKDGKLLHPEERVISRVNTDRKVRYKLREAGTPQPVMRGVYATRGALDD